MTLGAAGAVGSLRRNRKPLTLSFIALMNGLPSRATAPSSAASPVAMYTAPTVTASPAGIGMNASSSTVHIGTKL